MKALTVWQPWASLVVIGAKPYEYRKWPAPASLVGQRIVIHAGAYTPKLEDFRELIDRLGTFEAGGMVEKLARPFLEECIRETRKMPVCRDIPVLRAGVGEATLGQPVRCIDLYNGDPRVDEDMWAWPMLEPKRWVKPVWCKGGQKFWDWQPQEQLL